MSAAALASDNWLALVAAIRGRPDDDTPRLVAADWLSDTGERSLDAWAGFIRDQVKLTRLERDHVYADGCDCAPCRTERATVRAYDQWGYHWFAAVWGMCDVVLDPPSPRCYHRGFVESITGKMESWYLSAVPGQLGSVFNGSPLLRGNFALYPVPAYQYIPSNPAWLITVSTGLGQRQHIYADIRRTAPHSTAGESTVKPGGPSRVANGVRLAVGNAIRKRRAVVEPNNGNGGRPR